MTVLTDLEERRRSRPCRKHGLTPDEVAWCDDGAVIFPRLLPDSLIEAYVARYRADGVEPDGYASAVPYMQVEELRALCLYPPLMERLAGLVGEPVGLHLNLSGWTSTERNWHQDSYLNPPHVGDAYVAVWMALENVKKGSGPFQYVPGSHRGPVVTRDRMLAALTPEEAASPDWPRHSERILTPLYEERIAAQGLEVRSFLARKGDVLAWHGRLLHRGSAPRRPGTPRRALISHYTGVHHRADMPNVAYQDGHAYFALQG